MTIIDFMHAHPFITILAIWAGFETVEKSVHYISNAIIVRAQLRAGVPAVKIVRLKARGWLPFLQIENRKSKKKS